MTRLYVIGDRQTGVAFVTLNPLRAALVSREEIEQFANQSGKTFDSVFGKIAEAVQYFIIERDGRDLPANVKEVWQGIGALIETGTTISDAEFCFVADLDQQWFVTTRNPFPPIKDSLEYLALGKKGYEGKEYPAALHAPVE